MDDDGRDDEGGRVPTRRIARPKRHGRQGRGRVCCFYLTPSPKPPAILLLLYRRPRDEQREADSSTHLFQVLLERLRDHAGHPDGMLMREQGQVGDDGLAIEVQSPERVAEEASERVGVGPNVWRRSQLVRIVWWRYWCRLNVSLRRRRRLLLVVIVGLVRVALRRRRRSPVALRLLLIVRWLLRWWMLLLILVAVPVAAYRRSVTHRLEVV